MDHVKSVLNIILHRQIRKLVLDRPAKLEILLPKMEFATRAQNIKYLAWIKNHVLVFSVDIEKLFHQMENVPSVLIT